MEIIRDEKRIALTDQELEKAYREQLRYYQLLDAESHLRDCVSEDSFQKEYGFPLEEAVSEKSGNFLLNRIVERYHNGFDCNIAENDQYEEIVQQILAEIKK